MQGELSEKMRICKTFVPSCEMSSWELLEAGWVSRKIQVRFKQLSNLMFEDPKFVDICEWIDISWNQVFRIQEKLTES